MVDLPFPSENYVNQLLNWYARHGRDLPWRGTRDPYRIWLAEIMLQQTTVAAVRGYYLRFLDRFPRVEQLAEAPLEEVIDLWAGLGYYSRARNLHTTARQVVAEYQGSFPATIEELQSLPGIGRSTAGAIAALAFEQRAAILDGNVRRVLCRLCAWRDAPRSSAADRQLWHWSEQLTPAQQVHDYTQAIMDLGAIVCVPGQPDCESCPLVELCQARALGLEGELPRKQPKKAVPTRKEAVLLIAVNSRYLVRRRAAEGFLGGLWEFPRVTLDTVDEAPGKVRSLLNELGLNGDEPQHLGSVRHIYSHFQLECAIYRVVCAVASRVTEGGYQPAAALELNDMALHGAHRKVWQLLLKHGD